MKGKLLKGGLVVASAALLTTLGIFASDGLRGIDTNLTALTGSAGGVCPAGMVLDRREGRTLCVDMYEASASVKCPHQSPSTIIETEENVAVDSCYAASIQGALPWRFVSLPQAQRLCAEAGKRLPSSDEWYAFALGTEAEGCVIDANSPGHTGTESCVSSVGVYDTIGNVWEWANETVVGRSFKGRTLPPEGYVASVDASGVAITSETTPNELYGEDYFWSKEEGVFGMIRGGFYGSESDAGLYAINASVETSFASPGLGFRCVKDL